MRVGDFLVRQYWSIADGGKQDYEVPLSKVTKLLVSKHIAPDLETAKKIGKSDRLSDGELTALTEIYSARSPDKQIECQGQL